MKPNIEYTQILKAAKLPKTYQRGFDYYKQGRVESMNYDEASGILFASIEGEHGVYETTVYFDEDGDIEDYECDCPAFFEYEGACKHVVALLLEAKDKTDDRERRIPKRLKADRPKVELEGGNEKLFQYFKNLILPEEPTLINPLLEITLCYEIGYQRMQPYLELRTGLDRLYVVRNINEFVQAVSGGKAFEFGKGFTFNPARHQYQNSSASVIDILTELYQNEKLMISGSYSAYRDKNSLFKGKRVELSQNTLKRLLGVLAESPFNIQFSGGKTVRNAVIVHDSLPLDFSLTTEGKDLRLDMKKDIIPTPLTIDGQYFLYDRQVYRLTPEKSKLFMPFYNALIAQNRQLTFMERHKEKFVAEVLPHIERIGQLRIDDGVAETLHKEELKVKIYLDKENTDVTIRIAFGYGELELNPFGKENSGTVSGKLLVRNLEAEQRILTFFKQSGYIPEGNTIRIKLEEEIFRFASEILPQLPEYGEIYYSQQFKGIIIRDPGTLKGRVRYNDKADLLEFSFQHEGIDRNELKNIFKALKLKQQYYRLRDGSFMMLQDKHLDSLSDLLDNMDINEKALEKEIIQLRKYKALYMDSLIKQMNMGRFERNQAFKQLVQSITDPDDMDFELPKALTGVLREYQKTGFKWLKTLEAYKLGGILADDMGLGKTLQAIAFVLSNKNAGGKPCLVVAPTSLVYNWADEVEKFAPELSVLVIAGYQKQRQNLLKEIDGVDMVVTSYPLIRRDIEAYEAIQFSCCFLDEAQHIKNPDSLNAKSAKRIVTDVRYALTGTPIENTLTELWSIFDFIMPGYLSSHGKFLNKYERPIMKGDNDRLLADLNLQIHPFILRRLKKDVLSELPEKIETRLSAELTEQQKKIYLSYLNEARKDFEQEVERNGFERSKIKIFSILTRLRQICCHPAMFIENFQGESGKMQLFNEVLEDALEGGHRILVFSQFTSMLDIIEAQLQHIGVPYYYLSGSTGTEQRGEMVKRFNGGEGDVFLLSLKAGGTGLNLASADTVIHFDPWWNPAVEDQATDRAHRIGQKNAVQVIKLVAKGTIEEKVYELQEKKKHLIESVIQPGETFINKLSENEIRTLFQ